MKKYFYFPSCGIEMTIPLLSAASISINVSPVQNPSISNCCKRFIANRSKEWLTAEYAFSKNLMHVRRYWISRIFDINSFSASCCFTMQGSFADQAVRALSITCFNHLTDVPFCLFVCLSVSSEKLRYT